MSDSNEEDVSALDRLEMNIALNRGKDLQPMAPIYSPGDCQRTGLRDLVRAVRGR